MGELGIGDDDVTLQFHDAVMRSLPLISLGRSISRVLARVSIWAWLEKLLQIKLLAVKENRSNNSLAGSANLYSNIRDGEVCRTVEPEAVPKI